MESDLNVHRWANWNTYVEEVVHKRTENWTKEVVKTPYNSGTKKVNTHAKNFRMFNYEETSTLIHRRLQELDRTGTWRPVLCRGSTSFDRGRNLGSESHTLDASVRF